MDAGVKQQGGRAPKPPAAEASAPPAPDEPPIALTQQDVQQLAIKPLQSHPLKPQLVKASRPSCPACGAMRLSDEERQVVKKPGRRSTRDNNDPRNRPENLVTHEFLTQHIIVAGMSLREIGAYHGYTISTLSRRAKQENVMVGTRAKNHAQQSSDRRKDSANGAASETAASSDAASAGGSGDTHAATKQLQPGEEQPTRPRAKSGRRPKEQTLQLRQKFVAALKERDKDVPLTHLAEKIGVHHSTISRMAKKLKEHPDDQSPMQQLLPTASDKHQRATAEEPGMQRQDSSLSANSKRPRTDASEPARQQTAADAAATAPQQALPASQSPLQAPPYRPFFHFVPISMLQKSFAQQQQGSNASMQLQPPLLLAPQFPLQRPAAPVHLQSQLPSQVQTPDQLQAQMWQQHQQHQHLVGLEQQRSPSRPPRTSPKQRPSRKRRAAPEHQRAQRVAHTEEDDWDSDLEAVAGEAAEGLVSLAQAPSPSPPSSQPRRTAPAPEKPAFVPQAGDAKQHATAPQGEPLFKREPKQLEAQAAICTPPNEDQAALVPKLPQLLQQRQHSEVVTVGVIPELKRESQETEQLAAVLAPCTADQPQPPDAGWSPPQSPTSSAGGAAVKQEPRLVIQQQQHQEQPHQEQQDDLQHQRAQQGALQPLVANQPAGGQQQHTEGAASAGAAGAAEPPGLGNVATDARQEQPLRQGDAHATLPAAALPRLEGPAVAQAAQRVLQKAVEAFRIADPQDSTSMLRPLHLVSLSGYGGKVLEEVITSWASLPTEQRQALFDTAVLVATTGRWERLEASLQLEMVGA